MTHAQTRAIFAKWLLVSYASIQSVDAAVQQPSKEPTVADVVAQVAPATVAISGTGDDGAETTGSGFVIDPSGTIVTNLHVLTGLSNVILHMPSGDSFDRVTIRAFDEAKDLAIIQVPAFGLPSTRLANSDSVRHGDTVLLMGNPLGLTGSVSSGLVSAIRQLDGYRVFQTDAAASPGNSGGPLLNTKGEVIGVLTYKLKGGENLNFVVPINYARGLLQIDERLNLAEMNRRLSQSPSVERVPEPPPYVPPPSRTVALPGSGRLHRFRTLNDRFASIDAYPLMAILRDRISRNGRWVVEHDHSDGQYCRGMLVLKGRRLFFDSENISERWDTSLDQVTASYSERSDTFVVRVGVN